MYISNDNREVEFVVINVNQEQEIIDHLRKALARGYTGNIYHCNESILYIKKLSRYAISILKEIHGNLNAAHVYLVVGLY
jgi:hypothetical protein